MFWSYFRLSRIPMEECLLLNAAGFHTSNGPLDTHLAAIKHWQYTELELNILYNLQSITTYVNQMNINHAPCMPLFSMTESISWFTDVWPCSSSSFMISSEMSPCLFFTHRMYFSNRISDTTLSIMQAYSVMLPACSFTWKDTIFCIISIARASFTCKKQNTFNIIKTTLVSKLQQLQIT